MNYLDASDFATLDKGGGVYDKTNLELKPDFDRMWKHVTAFAKHVHSMIEGTSRPFPYEIGKSRNYLQQGGRGRFYYPRVAWIRYIKEGEKRNTPSVSMMISPDGIAFSLDFAEKYEKGANVSREAFTSGVASSLIELEGAGFERDATVEWPRFARSVSVDELEAMSDSEFDALAREALGTLLSVYEAMMGVGAEPERPTVTRRRRSVETPIGERVRAPATDAPATAGTSLARDVAAAALAAARGQPAPAPSAPMASLSGEDGGPTVVRRRRVVLPEEAFGGGRGGNRAPSRPRPPQRSEREPEPRREPRPERPRPAERAEHTERPERTERPAPPRPKPPAKRPIPEPRPIPKPAEQVSIVPPNVPESAPGLEELRERKAVLLHGAPDANMHHAVFQLSAALVRDALGTVKKRYELILDALRGEDLANVVSLALYEAPRGLSPIALQTHELVLHYFRTSGPYVGSLRTAVADAVHAYAGGREVLFERNPAGNWQLTELGRHHVDENFRYALQEAAKEKPRRYRIDDFVTILTVGGGREPAPLLEVHERRTDRAGALRAVVVEGQILHAIRRAARTSSKPNVLAIVGADPEGIDAVFGDLMPLIRGENRGSGALAPFVSITDIGPVSLGANLHVIVALTAGKRAQGSTLTRLGGSFGVIDLTAHGAGGADATADLVGPPTVVGE